MSKSWFVHARFVLFLSVLSTGASLQVPVFDRYLTLSKSEHFPIDSSLDWKGYSFVFGGPNPEFEADFSLRLYHRFRDAHGRVDVLQVCPRCSPLSHS